MKTSEQYINLIEKIFYKYNMSGSLLEKTYIEGIRNNNLTCCYVDNRIRKSTGLRKELREVIVEFVEDYSEIIKPLYM